MTSVYLFDTLQGKNKLPVLNELQADNRALRDDNQALRSDVSAIRKMLETTNKLVNKLIDVSRALSLSEPNGLASSPRFLDKSNHEFVIGVDGVSSIIHRQTYEDRLLLSSSGKHLVLKLISELFTKEELANSNVNGGPTRTGRGIQHKRALKDEQRYNAILYQAEKATNKMFEELFLSSF